MLEGLRVLIADGSSETKQIYGQGDNLNVASVAAAEVVVGELLRVGDTETRPV